MNKVDELISFWAQLKPNGLAFADESHEITFRQLDSLTRKIGFLLREKGIKRGDVVCLILPGYLGWLFSLTLSRLGVATLVQNNLDPFSPELIPEWVITLEPHSDVRANQTIIVNEDYLATMNASKELETLEGFANPTDVASFYSTSGTNGEAKYRANSAEYIWKAALRVHPSNAFGDDGVFILLPFGSTWTNVHFAMCLILGKTYYNCMFDDERLVKFVNKYPIRTLLGSPVQVSAFFDIQKQRATKLPLLKTIVMGGSPPSEQLVQKIKSQLDCRIFDAYCSTEAGFAAFTALGEGAAEGAIINPPVELQIVDDHDNPLPAMSVGHIRYRRDDMALTYYKNPAATAESFKNGFFYPGDLGFINHAGRLLLEGRSTEVINLGGVKVNPERIEAIALAQLGVIDCAAFGHVSGSGTEELCIALVVDTEFNQANFETAMAAKSPHSIYKSQIVLSIPRTETGKIQRNLLNLN
jgi:acyl-coenzyme A synthetase/AMP-(fatty) acid ligase